jgi:hypothetical protein
MSGNKRPFGSHLDQRQPPLKLDPGIGDVLGNREFLEINLRTHNDLRKGRLIANLRGIKIDPSTAEFQLVKEKRGMTCSLLLSSTVAGTPP